jgi:hypothetical protein
LYEFTTRYDPKLVIGDPEVRSPVIFRKKAVGGLPIVGVAVRDIPREMALQDSGNYIMDIYRKVAKIKTYKGTSPLIIGYLTVCCLLIYPPPGGHLPNITCP